MIDSCHRILSPYRCLAIGLLALSTGCALGSRASYDEPFSYEQIRSQVEGPGRSQLAEAYDEPSADGPAFSPGGISTKDIASGLKRSTGQGPKPDKAREEFAAAEAVYQQACTAEGEQRIDLFEEAGDQFVKAAKTWPDSSLEQDALFLAGESYFFAEHFPASNKSFEKLLKKHPNSRYIDVIESRRFAIAQHWLAKADYHNDSLLTINLLDKARPWRDTRGNGMRIFDRIRIDDPTGKLADDATMAAGNARFVRGDFVRADTFYTDVRKNFPNSEHQFMAHYLGVQSKLRAYQGPDYSGVSLDEAQELLVQIRRQFPNEFEKYRQDLERMYAEVRFKQAERDWTTAQYYEQRKAYGAAQFYYQVVLDEFPDTPFAEKSRAQIANLAGKPSRPEQKLEWLVNAFPQKDQDKPLMASGLIPFKR